MKKYRFLFTGGGTGGHVYPNIAIYEALKERYPDAEFLYVGTRKGSEASIIPSLSQPMEFIAVPARGLPQRIKSLRSVVALAAIFLGAVKSFFILRRFKPDIIIGSGGYAAAPVLLAAALLKKGVFIHEQNAVPGRLNLFIARFATKVGIAFPSSAAFFHPAKVVLTGYPLRRSIRAAGNGGESSREKLNSPPNSRVLFICSGSMGARTINRAAVEAMPRLLSIPNLFVVMSTGKAYNAGYKAYDDTVRNLERQGFPPQIEGRLLVREYFDHIAGIYAISDLVVSRAGAGAIQEITAMGLPAILVPKIDLPADHQILNAREIEKTGGARVLYEEVGGGRRQNEIFLPADALVRTVEELIAAPGQLAAMRQNLLDLEKPNSTSIILDAVEGIIGKKSAARESEIKTFYLQVVDEEKNLELPFPSTTVGNTFLADVPLENLGAAARFTVHLVAGEEFPAMLRVQKGHVLLNGDEVRDWVTLRPDDRLEVEGRSYIFKSYLEKGGGANGNGFPGAPSHPGSPLAARLADFGRAVAAAAVFGAGRSVDIFSTALAVAGFLRRLVGANAMGRVFMPIFARLFQRGPRKKAWEAASSLTAGTALLSLIIATAGMLLAPLLVRLAFPGFAARGLTLAATTMLRILLPVIILGTLAALMSVYLRAFNRRTVTDASALLFAVGTIAGIFLFLPGSGGYALAWSVLLGSLLQILFLLPFLAGTLLKPALEFSFRPAFRASRQVNRTYAAQLAPAGLGAALAQAPPLVERFVASMLQAGAISYLYFAMEIFRLPFTLVARAAHNRTLRDLTGPSVLFDRERTRKLLVDGFRNNLFLLAPLSILLIALANPIVSLLLERSQFSAQAVAGTALALQFYAIGLMGWGLQALTARIFAARLEARSAMVLDVLLLACQAPLAIVLARTPLGFAGIALAASIAYTATGLVRVAVLQLRLRREGAPSAAGEMISAAGKTLSACLLMVIAIIEAKFVFNRIQFNSRTIESIIFCVSLTFMGTAVYFLSSLLLKNTGILMFRKKSAAARGKTPLSLLSPFRFLEAVAANPDFYKAEYRYKVSIYLSSPSWEVRNVGLKLVGLFKDKAKVPFVVDMLQKRRGNGFMRRNALLALKSVNIWSEEIKELTLRLVRDNYFEVRAAALDYLGQNISEAEYAELRPVVQRRLARGSSEEKTACLRLMARKGNLGDLPRLERLYLDTSSLVREEVLEVLYSFYRRHLLSGEEVKKQVQQVLVTSDHLTPEFRIKSIIQRIVREADRP
jgi:undecaprenyldiphospho-muramoylpentapeptide beta-N-acetylglucosaminyltransferase/murein biosynthesis integral membrane protein MurJ